LSFCLIGVFIVRYPQKRLESVHFANCYIPAGLSAVLDLHSALVAPIVQAFYHRDNLDLKVNGSCMLNQPISQVLTTCVIIIVLRMGF